MPVSPALHHFHTDPFVSPHQPPSQFNSAAYMKLLEMNQTKYLNTVSTPILYPVTKILRAIRNCYPSPAVHMWVHSFLEIFHCQRWAAITQAFPAGQSQRWRGAEQALLCACRACLSSFREPSARGIPWRQTEGVSWHREGTFAWSVPAAGPESS